MKKILLCAVAILGLHVPAHAFLDHETVSIRIPDMRFYSVKALPALAKGRFDLIAAGQIKQNDRNEALLIAFSLTKEGGYREVARESFHVGPENGKGKTRIRSLVCTREPSTEQWLVVVNGKAGPENRERGFIRSYGFHNAFELKDSVEFSDPGTSYTHGYPLILADLNRDGSLEIVCGGFSGENDRDHADIRFYTLGKDGTLSQMKGFPVTRLDALPLRINALASGDLNQDGSPEVVAAGRTVENEVEHAAFVIVCGQHLIWKQIRDLGSCRYRYATVTDMNGDGRPELILGGRIDQGGASYALLDIWEMGKEDTRLVSRYRFTGSGSTRLRVVEPMPGFPERLMIAGRSETLQQGALRWKGFLQQMILQAGILAPCSRPVLLDKDWETRVRTMDIYENNLIAAGFTEDKTKASTAFLSVYPLK